MWVDWNSPWPRDEEIVQLKIKSKDFCPSIETLPHLLPIDFLFFPSFYYRVYNKEFLILIDSAQGYLTLWPNLLIIALLKVAAGGGGGQEGARLKMKEKKINNKTMVVIHLGSATHLSKITFYGKC